MVSALAHWITSGDDASVLLMAEGFNGAEVRAAALSACGACGAAVAGHLAEEADRLQRARDARQAGWLLLSVKLELEASRFATAKGRAPADPHADLADDLARDVDHLVDVLVSRAVAITR